MKTLTCILGLGLASASFAQFATKFEASEGYSASPSGTLVVGQNGWYLPIADSAPGAVFTYTGNTLTLPANPAGGDQFLGMVANTSFTQIVSRAQHDMVFGSGLLAATFEFCPNYLAAPPSTDNLGSFSLQPSASCNYFQTLYHYTDVNAPTTFTADYGVAGATGVSGGFTSFMSAGAAWTLLPMNHWYRQSTIWDAATNRVIAVSIQDLTAGGPLNVATPTDWYLSGGANNVLGQPTATAIRCFAGGSQNGNVVGYDNINVGPALQTLAPAAQHITLGQIASGDLASLAADDANAERMCRFILPNRSSPFVVTELTYNTSKTTLLAIAMRVKAKMSLVGQFAIKLGMKDQTQTNVYDVVLPETSIGTGYAVFTGNASGNLQKYLSSGGSIVGQISVRNTGPVPGSGNWCTDFEYAQLDVTGG
ncbi:MAG: hypothetical protein JSS66_15920 [Armatimonadetes bacterium]|nr:hypothetical protein [Armatimonadota bacterium]